MGSHHKEHIFEGAVELKYCGKCGLYLPLINFSKSSSSWDKLITSCKVCDKKYYNVNSIHIRELAKEDYKKNKDKNLLRNKERRESTDYNKNYYKKNKKRILDYSKKYYKENIQIFKQRYQDNKEYYNERNRKYYKERLEKIVSHIRNFTKI